MKFLKIAGVVLSLGGLGVMGCAHRALEKQTEQEISQETVKTHQELHSETEDLIRNAPGLTDNQRVQLSALQVSTHNQSATLREQAIQLRSALIQGLITTHYNEEQAELTKHKIKVVEDERLALWFNAVEKTNAILGHQSPNHPKLVNAIAESNTPSLNLGPDNESPIVHRSQLRSELNQLIKNAPDLDQKQRQELTSLSANTKSESDKLNTQSFQLRSVLIKELLSPNFNRKKVALLKTKMKDLEQNQLRQLFEAVHQTNLILGRWASRHERQAQEDEFLNQMLWDFYTL